MSAPCGHQSSKPPRFRSAGAACPTRDAKSGVFVMPRRFKKVPKDKKTGLPKKYVKGAKSPGKQAAEIKATAAAYKRGEKIDIKKVNKSRENQGKKTRRKKAKR